MKTSIIDQAITRYKRMHKQEMELLDVARRELEEARVNAATSGTSRNWLNFDHIGLVQQRIVRTTSKLDNLVMMIGKLESAKIDRRII